MKFMMAGLFSVLLLLAGYQTLAQGGYKIKTVVLDAGHGGDDLGCSGVSSHEKHVTLSIALKVGALIKETYPDIKVLYTRTTDVFVELHERAGFANRNKADLFISIHCNAHKTKTPYGTETWCMGLHKSEENLEVSKRENDVVLLEENYEQNYDGFDPNSPEGFIILSMNQNAHLEQSIQLASLVEAQFSGTGRVSRGVKQAGFLVLWRTTMPSILIETGFLTNREEEKYLASEAGQLQVAQCILNAVSLYKQSVEGYDEGYSISEASLQKDTAVQEVKVVSSNSTEIVAQSSKLIYRIQIAASSKPVNTKEAPYSSFKDIRNDRSESGLNRYVIGNYLSYSECMSRLSDVKKKGFKDAFVVAYQFEKRVPLPKDP